MALRSTILLITSAHKDPRAFFIELWKATWGWDATTFASWPCKFSRSAVRWEWWKKLQLRSRSAPPPAHCLTLCLSPAGVQLLHCVGPLACRTPDSQRAPSLPPSLAPSLPLRLFCSVPVFLFPALTQCYLRFNAARRRSAPSAGICKPALQGKKQTHLGLVTVLFSKHFRTQTCILFSFNLDLNLTFAPDLMG